MNELKHHGILGMKWGVRKQPDYNVKKYRANPVLTNGARIKKGASISRISRKPKEVEEGDTFGILNAGTSKMATAERIFISKFISHSGLNVDDVFQIDMETNVDLVLPDMKEKGRIVVNNILRNPKLKNRVIKGSDDFLGPTRAKMLKEELGWDREKDIENLLKKRVSYKLKDDGTFSDNALQSAYTTFLMSLNDPHVRGIYAKRLKKKGYNAVSDDLMDQDVSRELRWVNEPYLRKKKTNIARKLAMLVSTGQMDEYEIYPGNSEPLSTSSLIIFDRGKNLTVLKTKPYNVRKDGGVF